MKFALRCRRGTETKTFYYDNTDSSLTHEDGSLVVKKTKNSSHAPVGRTGADTPASKIAHVRTLKIQLGLSCNYSCSYCSQRFVPHSESTAQEDANKFVRNLDSWMKAAPKQIEFWGGEPFAYWKTLKPLAEAIRVKFPRATFLVITNGSLLNPEINEWLDRLRFSVGISHDGPGQWVRGPDPLVDNRDNVMDLFRRLAPQGRISFNAMVNRHNCDRSAIQRYFRELIGHDNFSIGEGSFIDPYDEGGEEASLQSHDEARRFRTLALKHIRSGETDRFQVTRHRVTEWTGSIAAGRPATSVGQKCGMDRPETIAVDLKGNVLTCQNVSSVSKAPNGKSHRIGHVSALHKVKLDTSTHWSKRANCVTCPLLQVCKGSCMFLEGRLWDKACDNAYSDHLPFFAAAIERLTGFLPERIEAEGLPPERQQLWEDA